MTHWMQLLFAALACGAGVVWSMVLSRRVATAVFAGTCVAAYMASSAVGDIAAYYRTPEAVIAGVGFLAAAAATGYAIAAASLPALARTSRVRIPVPSGDDPHDAIVLLACTSPPRYEPVAIATQGVELAQADAIEVPLGATPFVYLAERARYRALGGHSPGAAIASAIAADVASAIADRDIPTDVRTAWSYSHPTLVETVAELAGRGASRIAVVVLGQEDSGPVDRAKWELDAACLDRRRPEVAFGPSLVGDRNLTARLSERILGSIASEDCAGVGVVLVCPGLPPVSGASRSGASAEDTYFTQRVRMLLAEAGVDEHHVRVAWLEWQVPDVAESVRHLAALGCTRVIVAPATLLLPSVSTSFDLSHAIQAARVPPDVVVTTMTPWGDDPAIVEAVVSSAIGTLGALSRPSES